MNEPVGIFAALGGTIFMIVLFLISIVMIVLFALRWRYVKRSGLETAGYIVFFLTVLFSWFTQAIYVDSLLSVSWYRIVVPFWLPCLALGTLVIVTAIGRHIGSTAREASSPQINP